MRIRAVAGVPLAVTAVLSVPLAVVVAQPGGAAPASSVSFPYPAEEVQTMRTLLPLVRDWKNAINRRDAAAGLLAAERYEIVWQGVEAYTNHRSLPLYEDLEHRTQFVIEDELELPMPDWNRLRELVAHLEADVSAAIAMSAAGPKLSPLFEDLAQLRGVRAYALVLGAAVDAGDVAKAATFLGEFVTRFPAVEGLIGFRSQPALDDVKAALGALQAKLAEAAPDPAALKAAKDLFLARLGYGLNLLNAAARASVHDKSAVTDADKAMVGLLNTIAVGLRSADPAARLAATQTGPGSTFAGVQPTLEAKARLVNTAATFRSALAAFQTLLSGAPTADQVAAAQRRALEQVAIAQQVLVGQFWGDAALQAFLSGLPSS